MQTQDTIKRKLATPTGESGSGGASKSIKLESSADNSPRKDFSIAGLLSPQQQAAEEEMKKNSKGEKEKKKTVVPVVTQNYNDDDDEVVILPTPPKKSSPRSRKQPPAPLSPQRRLLPKTTGMKELANLSCCCPFV
jgi:hypothetical protein